MTNMTNTEVDASAKLISVSEAASRLHLTRNTVYELLKQDLIKGFRLPGRTGMWRIYLESVNDYIGEYDRLSPFTNLLKEIFTEDDTRYYKVLIYRYRDNLSIDEIASRYDTVDTRVSGWLQSALSVVKEHVKKKLTYDDLVNDSFALRVLTDLFLKE